MYCYNDQDKQLLQERTAQFRWQVQRYLNKELGEEEFRPLRLMNGLYLQIHAYMLRIAIPYGLISSRQMRMLAYIAKRYDKGVGHFTTRQNIQFNWPRLEDIPDILRDLANVDMHAIQTSGNCVRNTTTDPFAGVAEDELIDPRPYCEIIRQWSTLHPEFAYLPRKFKVAVSGATHDRTASQVHDVGLRLIKNAEGDIGFRVLVGGGLGRTPVIGQVIREFLPRMYLLSYLEAILRTYNLLGRRDNLYKSRIKILVKQVGIAEFTRLVEAEWQHLKDNTELHLTSAQIAQMQSFFTAPDYDNQAAQDTSFNSFLVENPAFARWVHYNVLSHKIPGYKAVTISLKARGVAPGDATKEQMEMIADLADKYSFGEIRTVYNQNLVLSDVKQGDLFTLWQTLEAAGLATPNRGMLTDIICCPGLDYCSLSNARSIPIAKAISERFADFDELYDLGEICLNMSGCVNACAHHHVAHIGILGVDKKGEEYYQIMLGGSAGEGDNASLGENLGPAISKDKIVEAIINIINVYRQQRLPKERFLETYRRIGMKPFKEQVYAAH